MEYSGDHRFDVIIVGAGVMGSSAAYQLAKRGHKTLLLEQFDFLHHRGSSHGESRTIRATYPEDYYYTMVSESAQLWAQAQSEIGYKVHFPTQQFDMGPKDQQSLLSVVATCRKHGLAHRVMDSKTVSEYFSGRINIPENWIGVSTDLGGVIKPTKAVSMFQTLALKNGAVLRDNTKVANINKDGENEGGVIVSTVKGEKFHGKKCIVTAGAWIGKLVKTVAGIEFPVDPLETTVCYWRIKEGHEDKFAIDSEFPTFASYGAPYVYGTPSLEYPGLIKVAVHGGYLCDPDKRPWGPGVKLEELKEWIKERFGGMVDTEGPVATQLCMYSMTPDEDFVIDFLGGEFKKQIIMPALSHSKALSSLPSVSRSLPLIQRLRKIHGLSSSFPESSPSPAPSNRGVTGGSLAKWISGIAAGSGLGFLYWSSDSDSTSGLFGGINLFSLADSSSTSVSDGDPKPRSRSFIPKLALPGYSSRFIFGDAYRRKIFFNYEKRLRLQSPPEKVFEYFASVRTSKGELLMKPADLMRAIVPVFPPSESHLVREGYLTGERNPGELRCSPSEFFMLSDVDNDGLISFKEYIFFVTLLSIPESSFAVAFKMFDTDNNGEIDKEEFKTVMSLMRSQHRQGIGHRDGLRAGFSMSGSVEDGGLVEYFFGKDGSDKLRHDKFTQFLKDLTEEMLRLEFAHYDYKRRGTISAKDFALSMVAAADASHLGKLLDRVEDLSEHPHLRDTRISLKEFKQFAELRSKLGPFSLALFAYGKANGLLTMKDFKRAASQVCGVSLSDNVIEIAFHVFDSNRDGNLSVEEFLRVLHRREKDISQPIAKGLCQYFSDGWNGSKKCSSP